MMKNIKIFCIPYAGSSASVFAKWNASVHPSIELAPIELAGRGARFNEPFYEDFEDCVGAVFDQIVSTPLHSPYALFGHSMGANIAFEVARRLDVEAILNPSHLFLSASRSPQVPTKVSEIHLMTDAAFVEELRRLGGTDEELFRNQDLLDIFLPIIRADFSMLSTYSFKPILQLLDMKFIILNGKLDDFTDQEIYGWQELSSQKCEFQFFEGGHFFIERQYNEVLNYIGSCMQSYSC